MSKHLNTYALKGLNKVGDIIIPGEGSFPSFSKSGRAKYIDHMLDYMNKDDLDGLKILLPILFLIPSFLLKFILNFVFNHKKHPDFLGKFSRLLMLGLKGLVMTVYYTDFDSQDEVFKTYDLLNWKISNVEAVKDDEMRDFITQKDFNSNLDL